MDYHEVFFQTLMFATSYIQMSLVTLGTTMKLTYVASETYSH